MNKIVIGVTLGLLALAGAISFTFFREETKREKNYSVLERWELPEILVEVSGIAYLGNNKMACVQDEDGEIFIFNLESSAIEQRISFSEGGDYEGLAHINGNMYVLRSDGAIFELLDFPREQPEVQMYETNLMEIDDLDLEGLAADEKNKRLLIAAKENPEISESHRLIYAFDLERHSVGQDPLWEIALEDSLFKEVDEKLEDRFNPSEIEMHPSTGEIYILEGRNPKLLVADAEAHPKKLFFLNEEDFQQPEGMSFSPEGDLYISNEGGKGKGNILRITLNKPN